jgi:glycosyltransferase involved in cell wall biosynthesis
MISLVIPSYNNLRHLKNVYASIKKHAPQAEIILLDDGSNDGTWEWMQQVEIEPSNKTRILRSESRVGHTILYDKGIELATNDIVGILHADMIIGPNYVENILKHLKPGTVVCGTRIEPPLHPEGKEKIIKDFGMDFDTLDIPAFEAFCNQSQQEFDNQTTKGMFAPWVIYKKDFQAIGGHDPLFAPFPYEDSDIFQRWILAGYELVQSRDSFVYHLTCRGHRWTDKIGENDGMFKIYEAKAARNYIRKWGSWIKNDEYQYPIITPKYLVGLYITQCSLELLQALEPWFTTVYVENIDNLIDHYIEAEQPNTTFDLRKKLRSRDSEKHVEILVTVSGNQFTNQDFRYIQQLSEIIESHNEVGTFELGNLQIEIKALSHYEQNLIVCKHK